MARIYLVEDNETLREAVCSYLELNDHEVLVFGQTAGILESITVKKPDLIILDVMLPDGDGFHLARKIRNTHDTPIIFLTAKAGESDRITGFEVGGDDYVVKPFSPKELALRVEAILRRSGKRDETIRRTTFKSATLELDPEGHRCRLDGRIIDLTAAEWRILNYLSARPETVVDRSRLLGESLDYLYAEGSERTIDTHIKNIRSKLGNPGWIETVRGFGYRFAGQQA